MAASDPLTHVSAATKAAIRQAVRQALERGARGSYLVSAFRRDFYVERAVRQMVKDIERRFDVDVDPAVLGVVVNLLASIERQPPLVVEGGAQLPQPPIAVPPSLTGALDSAIKTAGNAAMAKLKDELTELASQEVLWSARGVVKHYGKEAVVGPMSKIDPKAAVPATGSLFPAEAATVGHQIVQRVQAAPMGGVSIDKVWGNELGSLRSRVEEVVGQGLARGDTTDQIVRALRGTRAQKYEDGVLGKWKTRNVQAFVRTTATHTSAQARENSFASMGIPMVQLLATLDLRTTIQCIELDKSIWPVGEGPRPPIHVNCRTTVIPLWSREDADTEVRASFQGPVSGKLNAKDWWIQELSPEEQNRMLGVTRAQALRDGLVTFRQLLGPDLSPISVRELRSSGLVA